MCGRLIVFMSLFMFACAAPATLREILFFPFIIPFNAIAGEKEIHSNDHHILASPVMSEHRSNFRNKGTYSFDSESVIGVGGHGRRKFYFGCRPEEIGTAARGSYSYTTPDGVVLTVNWVADEWGKATGDLFPTPPPMPEHVRSKQTHVGSETFDEVQEAFYLFEKPDDAAIAAEVDNKEGFQLQPRYGFMYPPKNTRLF